MTQEKLPHRKELCLQSEAVYEDRLAVCKECKYLNEGLCGACGCFVELRAVIAVNRCPYEKW